MSGKKQNSDKLVNPLAKARGLGSTHHGVDQWLMERISAVILLPLTVWLVWSVVNVGADYESVIAWLQSPVNAVLLILTLLPLLYHAVYGVQVVIEDYVHGHGLRFISLVGIKALGIGLGVASVFSILKIAFSS